MITALDFGCYAIRSAYRQHPSSRQLTMFCERSEYTLLPNTDRYLTALTESRIPSAQCEDHLVVFGNRAADVSWLSRRPRTALFLEGNVPVDDPPARQILNVLVEAMLPKPDVGQNLCVFTVPGAESRAKNEAFLAQLIRMRGFRPLHASEGLVTALAAGAESAFTGVAMVMGAETSHVSVVRYGIEIASAIVPVGADWIDMEMARQFKMQTWDDVGERYLDLEAAREWKQGPNIHLRNTIGEREKMLARLYSVALDRITRAMHTLLEHPTVQNKLGSQRISLMCVGGPTQIPGFVSALTERLVEQDIASRVASVTTVTDPSTAVLRGMLIHGELEARRMQTDQLAA
jgi:hypothetical protein